MAIAVSAWCGQSMSNKQITELNKIASMIVKQDSKFIIKSKWGTYLNRYVGQYVKMDSKTEGTGAQAGMPDLKAVKKQVEKQFFEQSKNKDEKLLEAQRDQINRLMEMLEEMRKIHIKSNFDSFKPVN